MSLHKYFLVFLSLFILISCQQSGTPNEFTGYKFEMDFLNVDTFENQDWIEVDGVRFVHLSNMNDLQNTPWSLASSNVYLNPDLMPDRTAEYPGLSIAIDFGNYLAGINKNEGMKADHDYTYEVINQNLLLALGKLTVMRSDSSRFTIRVSPDYPVEVKVVE